VIISLTITESGQ